MKKSAWEKRGFSPRPVGEVKVQFRKWRNYSGPMIKGTEPYEVPDGESRLSHVERAYWLTAKVETGAKFGTVIAYDGTGMTAGLDQHIAVFPKELANEDGNARDDQGSLWRLLRRMEYAQGNPGYQNRLASLWRALKDEGWYLAQDGVLRYLTDSATSKGKVAGGIVYGHEIREALTPGRGYVDGPHNRIIAEKWTRMFHMVFSHPDGFRAQVEFGKEHLVKRTRRRGIPWAYGHQEITSLVVGKSSAWTMEEDLALCMYQAHSVNAPAIANKVLNRSADYKSNNGVNPAKLIRLLGTSSYGRWMDTIPNGRYQRTRSAARASGLWPRSMFDGHAAIMPKNL